MHHEILRVSADNPEPAALVRAESVLRNGEIVVFPTETVYGLGVLPTAGEAAERLNRLKGRDPGHPLTLHLTPGADLEGRVACLTPLARRLRRRFLPGPLTLVLPGRAPERETGVRVPRHAVCEALLERVGGALLGTSANPTGQPPATAVEELSGSLLRHVALVLDGGPSRYRAASTVVRPRGDRPDILREGAIPADFVRDESGPTTLIVCSGNTCRSPMGAVLLRDMLRRRVGPERRRRGLPLPAVESAGIAALDGLSASGNAILAMNQVGLDLTAHASRRLLAEDVLAADFVLTVSAEAAARIRSLAPEAADRVEVMSPDEHGIPDPFGSPLSEYVRCADRVRRALEAFLDRNLDRFVGAEEEAGR
jgi:tRNA threonylcarbamoyl adenosine modification protein (Sua5/YciO/YrdC/YwlC family)